MRDPALLRSDGRRDDALDPIAAFILFIYRSFGSLGDRPNAKTYPMRLLGIE